jgi:Anthranilate/para-aminobenzoate synthases component I
VRRTISFTTEKLSITRLKSRILSYCASFKHSAYYDTNNFHYRNENNYHFKEYELVAAANSVALFTSKEQSFTTFSQYHAKKADWFFGYLSYNLKNQFFPLTTNHINESGFADFFFFQPETVFLIKNNIIEIHSLLPKDKLDWLVEEITNTNNIRKNEDAISERPIAIVPIISKNEYLEKVNILKKHIQRGDIYEVNFCQEFRQENVHINPLELFIKLKTTSPTPFSAWFRQDNSYLLCASPERFLKRSGNFLLSQPIKGTCPRGNSDREDRDNLEALLQSKKEIAENVMIVDLVRNDLSKIAARGSVKVLECCRPYQFPQVYQLISTISCIPKPEVNFNDIIEATFPMGSMTGAPKLRAMQLADEHESFQRGIYSGAVGYIAPNGDFDFNVVIRSLVYNHTNGYLSYAVGGAITMLSDAQKEYAECLVKAKAIIDTLTQCHEVNN